MINGEYGARGAQLLNLHETVLQWLMMMMMIIRCQQRPERLKFGRGFPGRPGVVYRNGEGHHAIGRECECTRHRNRSAIAAAWVFLCWRRRRRGSGEEVGL